MPQVALEGARESLTLLKNDGDLLPLSAAHIHTIAVIGPDASPAVSGGGGSSTVEPFQAVSILNGLSNSLAGKVNVLFARGIPSIQDIFRNTEFTELKEEVFEGDEAKGKSVVSSPHRIASWTGEMFRPPAKTPQTVRYTGVFTPKEDGPYLFVAAAPGEDRFELQVDGKQLLDQPHREGHAPQDGHACPARWPAHSLHAPLSSILRWPEHRLRHSP